MDAFLRRVVRQRDAEEFGDDERRLARLVELTKEQPCRVCGVRCRQTELAELAGRQNTVCQRCGGRRRQARLEREDHRRELDRRRADALLNLAGIPGAPMNEPVIAAGRTCPHCGKKLRVDNSKGVCSACQARGKRGGGEVRSVGATPPRDGNARKQFKVVAAALGFDPDELIERFCRGWIDRVRASVGRVSGTDADDDYSLPSEREG